MTINDALALLDELKGRINHLGSLRSEVATKKTHWYGDQSKETTEPRYDVKQVDAKIVDLQNWIYQIKARVKQLNATTDFGMDVPVDKLLSPLT